MDTASLELSKQLADYFPCNGETTYWVYVLRGEDWTLMRRQDVVGAPIWVAAPDLGYLLRKLPAIRLETWHSGHVVMKWFPDGVPSKMDRFKRGITVEADTPENAAAALCIELIKQGIITLESAGA